MEQTTISCPACNHRVGVPRSNGDGTARCPQCDAKLEQQLVNSPLAKTVIKGDGSTFGGATIDFEVRKDLTEPSDASSPAPPDALQIPGFEILAELGRGGMGVVYKARQQSLNRIVAIKMIRAGVTAGDEERRRFQAEAEAVAQLQHPHIVQVYEVGEAHGQPFFVLEFVEGTSLDHQIDEAVLAPDAAAQLVAQLSEAMEAAHRKGIVHRDLKPGNVLLDGASPKITDFGLAKRAQDHGQTQTGQILGTPNYMAPEQAAGESRDVGASADVYALGAILYASLTGRPPFVGETVIETLDFVRSNEPVAPRQLRPGVPRDLETICLKCLRKEPSKRYASAQALADDLHRFLNDEAILGRPVGIFEKGIKLAKRRKALAGFLLMSFIAVAVFLPVVTILALQLSSRNQELLQKNTDLNDAKLDALDKANKETIALDKEKVAREAANRQNYALTIRQIFELYRRVYPNMERARDLHVALVPTSGELDFRSFEWHYLNRLLHSELESHSGYTAGFDSKGRLILGTPFNIIWKEDGREIRKVRINTETTLFGSSVSPLGRRIASIRSRKAGPMSFVYQIVWREAAAPEKVHVLGEFKTRMISHFAWSPDGSHLAMVVHTAADLRQSKPQIRVWRISDGKTVLTVEPVATQPISSIAISANSKQLAAGSYDRTVFLYRIADGKPAGRIRCSDRKGLQDIAFSPDGRRLCTAGTSGGIEEWNVDTRKKISGRKLSRMTASSVAYSPEGHRLAIGGRNAVLMVLELRTGKVFSYRGHRKAINNVRFSPDGKRVVSSAFRETKIWDVTEVAQYDRIDHLKDTVDCVRYSPNAQWIVYGSGGDFGEKHRGVVLRDLATGKIRFEIPNLPLRDCDFSSDSQQLVIASAHVNDADEWKDRRAQASLIDLKSGKVTRNISIPNTRILQVRFLTDDEILLGCADGTIYAWKQSTGNSRLITTIAGSEITSMVIAKQRNIIFFRGIGPQVRGWDLKKGKLVFSHEGNPSTQNVAVSPDGRFAAVPSPNPLFNRKTAGPLINRLAHGRAIKEHENHITIVNIETGKPVAELAGHSGPIRRVEFTADGKRLISTSDDTTIKVWDITTRHELISLNVGLPVSALAMSPDNRELLCAAINGQILRYGRSSNSK